MQHAAHVQGSKRYYRELWSDTWYHSSIGLYGQVGLQFSYFMWTNIFEYAPRPNHFFSTSEPHPNCKTVQDC